MPTKQTKKGYIGQTVYKNQNINAKPLLKVEPKRSVYKYEQNIQRIIRTMKEEFSDDNFQLVTKYYQSMVRLGISYAVW